MRPWNRSKSPLRTAGTFVAICLLSTLAHADDRSDLESLLTQFLDGAASDIGVHQRFWADDLIYTSSAGQRFGKAKIIGGMQQAEQAGEEEKPGEKTPTIHYRAESTDIRIFGNTAVVAFQLVAESAPGKAGNDQRTPTQRFFNTGTFIKRQGKWQAVAWQATRIPETQPES